jgi:hypothetical protein
MQTISLDILEKAGLLAPQSHAILKVMELELTSALGALATKADIAELRTATKADIAELRVEMAEMRSELGGETKGVDAKLTRWVLTCILGQTAVLAGLGYFALTHLQR